ncbi:hypothetical protein PN836_020565 [Ningiella sp. W23]|uniref:hypothetical protein n=1 Tax=Ningiella sp. W23 TaxID=3023715 RepID=UPI003758496A
MKILLSLEEMLKRRVPDIDAVERINSALINKVPFSFIRMNDGEAAILGVGHEHDHDQAEFFYHHWWGDTNFDVNYTKWLQSELVKSAESSDILGFFDMCDKKPLKFKRTGGMLRKGADLSKVDLFVTPEAHLNWHSDALFKHIFDGLDQVTLISCYDISKAIKRAFSFKDVTHIRIPGHAKYSNRSKMMASHPHDRFPAIMRRLNAEAQGRVYLIGAGVLGKLYANTIKEAGGVALDIGSVFDSWVGNKSRGSVRKYRIGF